MSALIDQELSRQDENIARAMLLTRGDVAKASRDPSIGLNAIELRRYISQTPGVRHRYHALLAEELQDKGLMIAERILKMAELQKEAFGIYDPSCPENNIPADPKMAIELSKEISRLIAEAKQANISPKSAKSIANKEDAEELLSKFLYGGEA